MFELRAAIEESPTRVAIRNVSHFLPALGVALLFMVVGYTKFDSDPRGEWFVIFERIGIGQWFRVVTGVIQVIGGALMLWRRGRTVGAAMLACTMLGAAAVDVFVLGSPLVIVPMLLLFLIAVAWASAD